MLHFFTTSKHEKSWRFSVLGWCRSGTLVENGIKLELLLKTGSEGLKRDYMEVVGLSIPKYFKNRKQKILRSIKIRQLKYIKFRTVSVLKCFYYQFFIRSCFLLEVLGQFNQFMSIACRIFFRKAHIVFLLSLCWDFKIRKNFFDRMAGKWKMLMSHICDTGQMSNSECIVGYC